MLELGTAFIISQILVALAMITDFLSMQYKKREYTFICLMISSILISAHYFLLNKIAAGIIVSFSVLRFMTCYFTTDKKYLYLFIILNTISMFFTYKEVYDLIIYVGVVIFIIGNFHEDNRQMRKLMMIGTSMVVIYNIIIFSPMGVVLEGSFLTSNIIGYYRHHIKKKKKKK
jgi:hypothetical protein